MNVKFRVHTSNLLNEILDNPTTGILKIPLSVLGKLLAEVGERAIELNDEKMNELMMRLTIYTAADPQSPDYSPELVKKYLRGCREPAAL